MSIKATNIKAWRKALLAFVTAATTGAAAQTNGINSSYSRFGMGLPADVSQGYNRSMGGVGQALRAGYRINMLNPASYSAIDSLTFLFDVGMSLRRTRMAQNGTHSAFNNTAFEYINAAFRIRRNLGMSVGFVPYTRIGYDFTTSQSITGNDANQTMTQQLEFKSADANDIQTTGGLHQAYIGAGWMPVKGFSVGANIGMLWGNVNHKILQTYSVNGTTTSTDNNLNTYYMAALKTWKADVGVQYQTLLNRTNRITFGATVGIGHTINSECSYIRAAANGATDTLTTADGFQIPMTYSVGVAWEHAEKWLTALDVTYEQWGNCTTPQYETATNTYKPATGTYKNRLKVNIGAEYVPARYDRAFRNRINYRAGAYFATPYINVNGNNGPTEFGLTLGVGIPITNAWANLNYMSIYAPSYVNVGLQWTQRAPGVSTHIRENVMQINIGLTFNEQWFLKWKFR